MTSIAASQTASGDGAAPARSLQDWLSPANILIAALLAIPFLALFFKWFDMQHQFSWGSPDWSHAYVVPLISAYVVWKSRDRLAELTPRAFWPGLLPLLLGVVCYYFFVILFPNHMFRGFAMVLTLFGLTLFILGPAFMTFLTFPIAYLAFAITISEMVMNKLTFQLQIIATWGAWLLLNIVGVTTDRAGNTLTILTGAGEAVPLNVAEACSGMRMLVAFYALGVAIAFLSCRQWWQRIALLILAGPVAIFVNILRVAFLGAATLVNPDFSQGDAHMFIGVLWLFPAFLLFMGVVWALKRIVHEDEPAKEAAP
ncbi:MAG: exosortase/archaeosortase family protein [Planctomycetota bacterium]|nr:exosortase/archaeosortase family protein [Planctomycetota bacterium]